MLSIGSHHHARHRQGPSFDFFFLGHHPLSQPSGAWPLNAATELCGCMAPKRQASVDELSACYEDWFVKDFDAKKRRACAPMANDGVRRPMRRESATVAAAFENQRPVNRWLSWWEQPRRHSVRTHASCIKCWQHISPLGLDEAKRSKTAPVRFGPWATGSVGSEIGCYFGDAWHSFHAVPLCRLLLLDKPPTAGRARLYCSFGDGAPSCS